MIVSALESLKADFLTLIQAICTSILTTKPNESLFSSVRGHVVTPDPLEFAHIVPKLVQEHVKK